MSNLNFVIPCNIILEIVMIALQSYVYDYSRKRHGYARIDQIYFGFVVPFLVFSAAWAYYFNGKGRYFNSWRRGLRITQGVILLIIGALMISSAQTIRDEWSENYYGDNQNYSAKIAAGVLAILNGIFYFMRPCKFVAVPVALVATPPTAYVAHNLGFVEAPPSYFPQQQQVHGAGTYFVQYQPGGQVMTQQLQFGYYAPPPPQPGFVHPQAGVQPAQH